MHAISSAILLSSTLACLPSHLGTGPFIGNETIGDGVCSPLGHYDFHPHLLLGHLVVSSHNPADGESRGVSYDDDTKTN